MVYYNEFTDHKTQSFQKKYTATIHFLQRLFEITRNISIGFKVHWKPIQTEMMLATKNVLELQEKFLKFTNLTISYSAGLHKMRWKTDFTNVRFKNRVPTAKEFKTALRLISISQFFVEPTHGNNGITNDIPLVDLLSSDGGDIYDTWTWK